MYVSLLKLCIWILTAIGLDIFPTVLGASRTSFVINRASFSQKPSWFSTTLIASDSHQVDTGNLTTFTSRWYLNPNNYQTLHISSQSPLLSVDGTTDHMISTMSRDGKSTEKKQDTNTAFSNYSVTTRQSSVAEIEVSARVTKILPATTATRTGESNPAIRSAVVATKETVVAVVTTTKASGKLTTKLGTITTIGAMGVTASPKTAETTTALMKIAATPIATATTTTAAATMVVAAIPKAAATTTTTTTTALATRTRNVAVLTATTDKAVEKQKTTIGEAALATKTTTTITTEATKFATSVVTAAASTTTSTVTPKTTAVMTTQPTIKNIVSKTAEAAATTTTEFAAFVETGTAVAITTKGAAAATAATTTVAAKTTMQAASTETAITVITKGRVMAEATVPELTTKTSSTEVTSATVAALLTVVTAVSTATVATITKADPAEKTTTSTEATAATTTTTEATTSTLTEQTASASQKVATTTITTPVEVTIATPSITTSAEPNAATVITTTVTTSTKPAVTVTTKVITRKISNAIITVGAEATEVTTATSPADATTSASTTAGTTAEVIIATTSTTTPQEATTATAKTPPPQETTLASNKAATTTKASITTPVEVTIATPSITTSTKANKATVITTVAISTITKLTPAVTTMVTRPKASKTNPTEGTITTVKDPNAIATAITTAATTTALVTTPAEVIMATPSSTAATATPPPEKTPSISTPVEVMTATPSITTSARANAATVPITTVGRTTTTKPTPVGAITTKVIAKAKATITSREKAISTATILNVITKTAAVATTMATAISATTTADTKATTSITTPAEVIIATVSITTQPEATTLSTTPAEATTASTTTTAEATTVSTTITAETTVSTEIPSKATTVSTTPAEARTTASTTLTTKATTVSTKTPAEASTASTTTTAEATTVSTTITAEATTVSTTITAETTVSTEIPSEATTVSTTPAEAGTTASTTLTTKATTASTKTPAEASTASTTTTAEATTLSTTTPAEATTVSTIPPEATTVLTTIAAEATTVSTTIPPEATTASTTITAEATTASTTTLAEATTTSKTITKETTASTTTTPAGASTASTTVPVEATFTLTTTPKQTTNASTTIPVEATTVSTTTTVKTTISSTTTTVEASTASTAIPVEATTTSTTPPKEATTVSTTPAKTTISSTTTIEASTASTTIPAEATTTSTTLPKETTTASTTIPAEATTVSTTTPAEATILSTTTPAEASTASTTTPAEATTLSTTTPAEATTLSTTTQAEETTASTTITAKATTASTTPPTETTRASTIIIAGTTIASTTTPPAEATTVSTSDLISIPVEAIPTTATIAIPAEARTTSVTASIPTPTEATTESITTPPEATTATVSTTPVTGTTASRTPPGEIINTPSTTRAEASTLTETTMTKPKTTNLGEAKTEVPVQLSKTTVQVIGNIAKTKQMTITCVFKDVMFCNTGTHTPPPTTDAEEHYQMLTSITTSFSVTNGSSAVNESAKLTISHTSIRTVATLPTELSFGGRSNSRHWLLTVTTTTRVAGQSSDVSKGAKNVGLSHNTTVLLSRTVQRVSSTMTSKTSASVTSAGNSFSATTLVLLTPLAPSKMFSHLTSSPAFIRIEATLSLGSSLSGRPNSDQPLLAASTSTRVAGQSPDVRRSKKNVGPSHNNTTVLLSRTIQMLPSTMPSQTDVSVTSVNISYGTTTLALSTPLARNKTFSLLSFSSAEFSERTAFSPDLYTSRKKVTFTYNSTIMVSRVRAPRIVKTISSFQRSSSAAFSIVDDISKTRAIWGLLSSLFKNKTSMAKERLPSSINSDVLTTTKRETTNNTIGTSYPFDHSSSMTDVISSSTTFRPSAFFSGIDTTSGFLFHNRTVQQSSLFMIQSRTISLQVRADSENIISDRTSFASSHSIEILERSVPLVQITSTLNTITSLHPLNKSTGNYTDVYASSRISSFNTIKSILPTTKLKPFTSSPVDLSSEFNFPRTTISGSQTVAGTLVSPVKTPYIETSRILLSSSFKTFEATIVAIDLSAPRTSTSASRNLTRTFSTSPSLQNETITSRTVVSSTISKWKRSTGWFTSSRRRDSFSHASASVFEYSSRRQSTTTYASPIISSTIQLVSERTFTPHITLASTRRTLSKDSSSQSLWITSETSQWTISPTSILVSPSSIYYTVQTEFTPPFQTELYRESASQTRPFTISSVVKSNNVNSITSSGLRTFPLFLTTSNDFSKSADSPHQAITFLSSAVKNTLSLRTFPSVNKTSSREKLQTSVGSSLKHKTANTLSVQNFYGHTDDSSREFFNGEIIASGTLNIDYTIHMPTLKLTTVESSQLLSTYPSRVRQSLTSLASSTGKIFLESIIPSTTTPREALSFTLTTKTTLKRTSQTSTEALCTQLSTMLTTLMPSSTLQTARVSMVTRKTVSSNPFMDSWTIRTVVSASHSTGYTLKSSSLAPAATQSALQFLPNFSNDYRPIIPSSSPLLEMSSSQVNVWPTSALRISQKNDRMTTMRTIENPPLPRSLYSRETSALSGSVATERFPFSVKSKSQWTQSATELLVATSSGKISSTILNMSKPFTTSSHPISSSVSVLFQTGPPPEDPKQFEGTMVLQMPWNLRYLKTYTPEYQTLASTIKREISKAFTNLEGFLSVQVLRFWESSVGVDFLVFVRKSANIDENTVERMLTEANNTGVLDIPITSLQVNERGATTTASVPTPVSSKSLEQWVLVLIVAGILVFLLLLIICILAVKLARRSGGFKRSKKYELSRWSNYIHTEYPDSAARSKTNLPVILSMEEKRQYVKDDSYEELTTYNITESKSDESLTREAFRTKLRETRFNGNPEFRHTNQESRISPSEAAVKGSQRSVSTKEYPAQWNKGCDDGVKL